MVEAGAYTVQIGASSTDLRLYKRFTAPEMVVEQVRAALGPQDEF
jgi:hypothetical protein